MASADSSNSYIPKYISNVPWYYKTALANGENDEKNTPDALAHHRKTPGQNPVDHSQPQAGSGITDSGEIHGPGSRDTDDYDAKRDRWHGHSAAEWDDILAKWESVKSKTKTGNTNEDSDDTDYELELEELGLARSDLKSGHVEDPMEKTVRDRRDVPAYIRAINGNVGGKIRLGTDSTSAIVNDDSEFVKESQDMTEFKKMQKFAWEQNQEFEQQQKKAHYDAQLASLSDPNAQLEEQKGADLSLSMEASPTLMMLRNRQNEEARRKEGEKKRRKLMEMYGS